jgi:hypothetical protein
MPFALKSRYVGNILELLRLQPRILEAIERLPVGTGNGVTERGLRLSLGCLMTSS